MYLRFSEEQVTPPSILAHPTSSCLSGGGRTMHDGSQWLRVEQGGGDPRLRLTLVTAPYPRLQLTAKVYNYGPLKWEWGPDADGITVLTRHQGVVYRTYVMLDSERCAH